MPNTFNPENTLVLFDAYHYLHRAYHVLRLSTKQGEPVGAVFGFARTIVKLLKQFSPLYFAVCWDSKPTERMSVDPEYKANRVEAPDDLKSQMILVREFVAAWGLPSVEALGHEADDLMATLSVRAKEKGLDVVLVTSDKDMLQLIGPGIRSYLEHKDEWLGDAEVEKKFGLPPCKLVDYFTLVGDATDNIRGVPGVGPKTAVGLLKEYGDLDTLIQKAAGSDSKMSSKVRQSLLESRERLAANKKLVRLNTELPLEFDPRRFSVRKEPQPQFEPLLLRLGFASLIKDLKLMGWPLGQVAQDSPKTVGQAPRFFVPEEGTLNTGEDDRALEDAAVVKIAFDWKRRLHEHPVWADRVAGELLDAKLLAWIADTSEESYALDWLMAKYKARDLAALAFELKAELERQGVWRLYEDVELPLTGVLWRMESAGVRVDAAYLERLNLQWSRELERLRGEFLRLSGADESLNLNSPKQLAVLFFEQLKLPVIKKTKTGYSTDEEVLKRLEPAHPSVSRLLAFRELSKLRSTYVEGLLQAVNPATGQIHATFHQEGTQTGRVSCTNPNLQNIPIRTDHGLAVRQAFVASRPEWNLVSLDYSQIDLRVFAHLSGDPDLIKFFREGRDIHEETARAVLAEPGAPVTPEMRRRAKAVNFGILYGMSSWGLGRELNMSEEEAQSFIALYNQRFPGVASWREQVIFQAHERGYVETILGRRRPLPNINAQRRDLREFSERAAVNTPVQGSAADVIKLAMLALERYIKERGLQSRMLIQVHDEILLEGPSDELQAHGDAFRKIMEQAMELKVPLAVHSKTGRNWREMN